MANLNQGCILRSRWVNLKVWKKEILKAKAILVPPHIVYNGEWIFDYEYLLEFESKCKVRTLCRTKCYQKIKKPIWLVGPFKNYFCIIHMCVQCVGPRPEQCRIFIAGNAFPLSLVHGWQKRFRWIHCWNRTTRRIYGVIWEVTLLFHCCGGVHCVPRSALQRHSTENC